MTTVSTEGPQLQSAIQACALVLRRMADYELDPALHRRLRDLGGQKEFLSPAEHEELLALVDFAHQRTREKLEAKAALEDLRTALPGVLSGLGAGHAERVGGGAGAAPPGAGGCSSPGAIAVATVVSGPAR